jgi:hypothetical protein
MMSDAPLRPKLPDMPADSVHRYPISNSIAFVILGIFLLALSGSMLALGILSLWSVFALVMAIVAIGGGFKALATRKRFPMIVSEDQLAFYRKGKQCEFQFPKSRAFGTIHEGSTNEFRSH